MAINGSPILFAFAHMKQWYAQGLSSLQYYYQLSFSGKHTFFMKKKMKSSLSYHHILYSLKPWGKKE